MKQSGSLGAIVLAAGKGKRMNSKSLNKVALPLGRKPMILHTMSLLKSLKINKIIVVVGFAKDSVMKILGNRVNFAYQPKRLGTGHAVSCALRELPKDIDNVLVLNGDDSAFYRSETIKKLIQTHFLSNASLTFLTIHMDNPRGLGRIVRDKKSKVRAVVEEKDASEDILKVKEVNPACYIFKVSFLKKYLPKVKKSSVTGEYYLTSLIDLAVSNNEKIETLKGGKLVWRGVNTKEELEEAQKLFSSYKVN